MSTEPSVVSVVALCTECSPVKELDHAILPAYADERLWLDEGLVGLGASARFDPPSLVRAAEHVRLLEEHRRATGHTQVLVGIKDVK